MKSLKSILLIAAAMIALAVAGQRASGPVITSPPDSLGLDPFYCKYMNVNGIHVCSSWRVPDSCYEAAYVTLDAMTRAMPPEVLKALAGFNTRIAIMARYEGTTDLPEHRYLAADTSINWDLRARGLGADTPDEITSCAEENILAYQIDKYHAEDILVHEFSHTLHLVGIASIYPEINEELQAALDSALAEGKWKNVYASTDFKEYFAEGVQNWFNVNAEVDTDAGDGKHNRINTREEMRRYDPRLYRIIARYFPETDIPISRHKAQDLYHWEGE